MKAKPALLMMKGPLKQIQYDAITRAWNKLLDGDEDAGLVFQAYNPLDISIITVDGFGNINVKSVW